ncbi:DUF2207 domain-containing protein [Cellulomonas alba]|uniref:DUF2207 domain-containing protein n=1 Tax=Cellulomonas alba TaxID=3053467 RepID=A0ABT7SMA6_9CELL|nr:DUF2207 domain-containing protein [Cellulomonas alba]MDM7856649.1 DUF2207 domain-containing protein [Cellulomonas alba]
MRRALLAAAAAAVVALGTLALAGPAAAAPPVAGRASVVAGPQTSGREITRYDATATLDADGKAHVVIDFDFDFGDNPGHGPFLTLVTRQGYDDQHDRAFRYSDITSSSSTGAPAKLNREDTDNAIILRIGDPDRGDISGTQTYRVSYTVDGLVNPANPDHSGDELYWNVIGSGWEVPLDAISVKVTGPADVEGAACFAGPSGSTDSCTSAQHSGPTSTFTQDALAVGDQLSTVTGWPGGTFPGVEPIIVAKPDPAAAFRPLTPWGAVALALLVAGVVLAVRRIRRVGRDRAYLGLTPGLRPGAGQTSGSGYRDKRAPIAVQFTPPDGVRPGQVGTLVDEKADPVDVTATLVDLAVRGYLRIEAVPRSNPEKAPKDWTLVQLEPPPGELHPYEATLLNALFTGRSSVRLSDLRTTFASSMKQVQDGLYEDVTRLGWFRSNPSSVRAGWVGGGIALLVAGGLIGFFLLAAGIDWRGVALVPIALVVIGIVVAAMAKWAPARTEDGTAVLAQTLGFRQYIATAEANQIRFEEGQDVFSRYLPYAIIFGLTDRWARVFAELAAQGRAVAQPSWYVGGGFYPGPGLFWATGLASSMDRFSSIATSSLSAPTPGSSGGSGFSGGGFSGGGVGGGGGGGW